jgi:hypothetical protein
MYYDAAGKFWTQCLLLILVICKNSWHFRRWVTFGVRIFRLIVFRCSVIRCSVIRCSVIRRSVIRCTVIRRPVFRRSVGESLQGLVYKGLRVIHRGQRKVHPNWHGPSKENIKNKLPSILTRKKKNFLVSVETHLIHIPDKYLHNSLMLQSRKKYAKN